MLRLPQQSQSDAAQLLAMQQAARGSTPNATRFGPGGCVSLSKSNLGTCIITVSCGEANMSQVDFGFVCLNRAAEPKRTQHSYGKGGFENEEVFDTGVPCDSCSTVAYAQFTGGMPVHNEVLVPGDKGSAAAAPSPAPGEQQDKGGVLEAPVKAMLRNNTMANTSDQTAFFGPSACISTYLSPAGTCMIQTRCRGVDLSNFAVGVTCLDKTGDYTRYLFGKNGFEDEELFDTSLKCQACIGVGLGDQPSYQLSGLVPKTIVEDLSTLKTEVTTLRKEVALLKQLHNDSSSQRSHANASTKADSAPAPSPTPAASGEKADSAPAPSPTPAASGEKADSAPAPSPTPAASGEKGDSAPAPSPTPAASGEKADSAPAPSPTPAASGKKGDPTPAPTPAPGSSGKKQAGQQLLAASTEPAGDDLDKPITVRDLLRRLVAKQLVGS